mgnify:CR=1 FL=1
MSAQRRVCWRLRMHGSRSRSFGLALALDDPRERAIHLSGRAALMHPLIRQATRARIPDEVAVDWRTLEAHVAAAKCAVEKLRAME